MASRSPWLHEEEARAQGLALSYELFDFSERGLDDAALPGLLAELRQRDFAGVNVTYPFKQAVIPLLDELAESARLVGAVNTIAIRGGRLIGHNTDFSGFRASLIAGLRGRPLGHVLQLGAGGAGAAVAHALLATDADALEIYDVDAARATALVDRLQSQSPDRNVSVRAQLPDALDDIDGIVNATPIGMALHPGSPIDPALLRAEHWVADIVYFPLETALLRAARELGCLQISGAGMVIAQAAGAFEIITGHPANIARMTKSFFE